jgi:hypothetical protein
VEKAIGMCEGLPYFHREILKKMLRWDALERPTSIKLKRMFSDEKNCLLDNLDNVDFVDELIGSIMKTDDTEMIDKFNQALPEKDDSYDSEDDDESIQFTIKKE